MAVKEFIVQRIRLFFILTVLILIAQCVIGSVFAPEQTLHYSDLTSPLTIAALCILPTAVTFSRKKLTLKQVLIRHAIQLALIEGVILLLAFTSDAIDSGRPVVLLTLMGATLIIYVLAVFFIWLGQLSESRKMTVQLHRMQENAAENN